jgi:hypothetical protein
LDGDVYVDFLGEFTAGIYGHSNELIATAVSKAMKKGWNYGGPNQYERELARKVGNLPFIQSHICFQTRWLLSTFQFTVAENLLSPMLL